ncbi:methyltransferase domain-containing protein [Leptolyngbya cf. ectocarpi LEGE 11479]|uniref:Methyltransferase domain-containing protein n=1 Tax=Leptolyngbya cf. ectocarpi LEGE 11479 TaxID=1828722 RepID=A0A929F559_LEPEC|nr:methyltransferase dimerization domain-containing protein [Leptolyngbya ectocarpi]MBE9067415.1 methyltransferase domain-containing protein [Leptolyngbya cf. ectocarpi LEGE 11479]
MIAIQATIYHFWNSAILRAAIKLGIFPLIAEHQPCSCEFIASQLKANSSFMQSFLEACVVLELLEKDNDQYSNTQQSAKFLIPDQPDYMGDLALHITNHWNNWGNLDQLMLEGRTELPFENNFVDIPTYWQDYMYGQHNRAASGQAANLVQHTDLTGRKKLIDLGGGMGSYSIALCRAYPQLQACIVDQKEPLILAQKLLDDEDVKVCDRISLQVGDFYQLDLDTDNDVALISGVVCIQSADDNRRLFSRAFNLLKPGGIVIVQDFMQIGENRQKHFLDTMMDMYLKIAFAPEAADFAGDDIAAWLVHAGFSKPQQILLPTQLNLITAEK